MHSLKSLFRIITDVLIDHVSDDEKIRIDRKAVKLVKLAILPSDVRIFLIYFFEFNIVIFCYRLTIFFLKIYSKIIFNCVHI